VARLDDFHAKGSETTNGVLFDKAQETLLEFPGGLGGSYTIPNGVTSIGAGAFELCTNLTSAFFWGNAPHNANAFPGGLATVYYLPGTTG
jgi:hypothetical protein